MCHGQRAAPVRYHRATFFPPLINSCAARTCAGLLGVEGVDAFRLVRQRGSVQEGYSLLESPAIHSHDWKRGYQVLIVTDIFVFGSDGCSLPSLSKSIGKLWVPERRFLRT